VLLWKRIFQQMSGEIAAAVAPVGSLKCECLSAAQLRVDSEKSTGPGRDAQAGFIDA
jgi:hypothetical protein